MALAIFPIVLLIAGLLMWALSANPKVQRIGEWMFVIGLLWTTYFLGTHQVKLFD